MPSQTNHTYGVKHGLGRAKVRCAINGCHPEQVVAIYCSRFLSSFAPAQIYSMPGVIRHASIVQQLFPGQVKRRTYQQNDRGAATSSHCAYCRKLAITRALCRIQPPPWFLEPILAPGRKSASSVDSSSTSIVLANQCLRRHPCSAVHAY